MGLKPETCRNLPSLRHTSCSQLLANANIGSVEQVAEGGEIVKGSRDPAVDVERAHNQGQLRLLISEDAGKGFGKAIWQIAFGRLLLNEREFISLFSATHPLRI